MPANVTYGAVTGSEPVMTGENLQTEDINIGSTGAITTDRHQYMLIVATEDLRVAFGETTATVAADSTLIPAGQMISFGPFQAGWVVAVGAA